MCYLVSLAWCWHALDLYREFWLVLTAFAESLSLLIAPTSQLVFLAWWFMLPCLGEVSVVIRNLQVGPVTTSEAYVKLTLPSLRL